MFKMGSHDPFGYLKHKLWPKERSEVKLAVWVPTIKSWESTQFPCVKVVCDTPLESSWRELQLFFRCHLDQRFAHKVIALQSRRSSNFGSPGTKCHLDVGLVEKHKVYYMGEGGRFPRVQAVVSLVSPRSHMARPSTKSAATMH
jgi:hypothetical protein